MINNESAISCMSLLTTMQILQVRIQLLLDLS